MIYSACTKCILSLDHIFSVHIIVSERQMSGTSLGVNLHNFLRNTKQETYAGLLDFK